LRLQQMLANFGIAFLFGATGIGAMPLRSARRPYLAGIGGQLAAVHSAAKLNHRAAFLQKAARPAKKHVGCFERGMRPHIVAVRSRQCIISREKQKPFFNA
jgi:hypothetical protein